MKDDKNRINLFKSKILSCKASYSDRVSVHDFHLSTYNFKVSNLEQVCSAVSTAAVEIIFL